MNTVEQVLKEAEIDSTLPRESVILELFDVCERTHAHCNDDCPVYKLNGSIVPCGTQAAEMGDGCDCFKSGSRMLTFIEEKLQVYAIHRANATKGKVPYETIGDQYDKLSALAVETGTPIIVAQQMPGEVDGL